MKKRNEEGYVLVYVMVVVFVLCAIATALITQTIHTMAAQKNMVDRMQDKYVAMGEIERVVAELEYTCEHTLTGRGYSSETAASSAAESAFISHIKSFASASDSDPYTYKEEIPNPDTPSYKEHYLLFDVERGNIQISATLQLLLDKSIYDISAVRDPDYASNRLLWELEGKDRGEPEPQEYTYDYSVGDVVLSFTSYAIGGAT